MVFYCLKALKAAFKKKLNTKWGKMFESWLKGKVSRKCAGTLDKGKTGIIKKGLRKLWGAAGPAVCKKLK